MRDAMLRTFAAADSIGVRALLLPAIDDQARSFYLRLGFQPAPTDRLHLMILLKDIAASLNAAGGLSRAVHPAL